MKRWYGGPAVQWPGVVGGALIAAGLLGILLSLAGMIFVAQASAAAERTLNRELATLDRTLATTDEGLAVAGAALADTEQTLGSVSGAIGDATRAISDTAPTLQTLQDLTGTTLPRSLTSTRQALDGAQQAALVADRVLGALSFLGLSYNPEIPLNVAIGQVSASLANVPADLQNVATGLTTAETNLGQLTTSLDEVAAGVERIRGSVERSTRVVDQYRQIVAELRREVTQAATALPGWIGWARWWGLGFLAAIALGQIGLLVQGWELLLRNQD